LPNVKFTGGDETDDERLKFQFVEQPKKPDNLATSRRVQRLGVRPVSLGVSERDYHAVAQAMMID